jgi:branched-chain amino acid transport system substrate-binding protein
MGKDQVRGKNDIRRNYASLFLPQSNSIVAAVIGLGMIFHPLLPQAIADDTTDIRIGVTAPLTGAVSSAGQEIQRGIELAKERLRSEQIGVKIIFEDACLPAPAVSAVKKMIESDRIEALVGNYCVIALNALRPIIENEQLLTLHNSSAPEDIVSSSANIFTTWPSIEREVQRMVDTIGEERLERAGIVYLENPWAAEYAKKFRDAVESRGFRLTVNSSQELNQHDFRSDLTKLKSSKTKAALVAHTGEMMVSFLKQARTLKIPGSTFFVPSDNDDQTIIDAAGSAAEGLSLFSAEAPEQTAVQLEYQREYEKRYNRRPDPISRHAYDQLILVARALTKCKRDTSCAEKELGSTRDFEGASGRFSITESGLAERSLYLKQVRNGKFEYPVGAGVR